MYVLKSTVIEGYFFRYISFSVIKLDMNMQKIKKNDFKLFVTSAQSKPFYLLQLLQFNFFFSRFMQRRGFAVVRNGTSDDFRRSFGFNSSSGMLLW